jgi:hypothetical protein
MRDGSNRTTCVARCDKGIRERHGAGEHHIVAAIDLDQFRLIQSLFEK